MEEIEDPDIGPMIVWTDEERDEIMEEAALAREELLEKVSDTSRECLPDIEFTTNAHEVTIAEFDDPDEEDELLYVFWRVGADSKYEVFSSSKGTVCHVSGVSGIAQYLNEQVL